MYFLSYNSYSFIISHLVFEYLVLAVLYIVFESFDFAKITPPPSKVLLKILVNFFPNIVLNVLAYNGHSKMMPLICQERKKKLKGNKKVKKIKCNLTDPGYYLVVLFINVLLIPSGDGKVTTYIKQSQNFEKFETVTIYFV